MAENSELRPEVFEAEVTLSEPQGRTEIRYALLTDLPAGTLVALAIYRSYLNWRNEKCVWVMVEDELVVRPNIRGHLNGVEGVIDVAAADREGRNEFEQRLKSSFSAGIQTAVSNEIELIFTVGARQRVKAFGKNNRNLVGPMVDEEGGVRFIEIRKVLNVPMLHDLQPLETETEGS